MDKNRSRWSRVGGHYVIFFKRFLLPMNPNSECLVLRRFIIGKVRIRENEIGFITMMIPKCHHLEPWNVFQNYEPSKLKALFNCRNYEPSDKRTFGKCSNAKIWISWYGKFGFGIMRLRKKRLPLGLVPVWRCDWLISALYDWVYPEWNVQCQC